MLSREGDDESALSPSATKGVLRVMYFSLFIVVGIHTLRGDNKSQGSPLDDRSIISRDIGNAGFSIFFGIPCACRIDFPRCSTAICVATAALLEFGTRKTRRRCLLRAVKQL